MNSISFHNESVNNKTPSKRLLKAWIKEFVSNHGKKVGELAFVFCSDEKILEINQNFLQHDYYTDIITFDYSEGEVISGDIFISVERVLENAASHQVDYNTEHGINPTTVYKTLEEILQSTSVADIQVKKVKKRSELEQARVRRSAEPMMKYLTDDQRKDLIEQLYEEMKKSARELDFERAAELRDEIERLRSTM